ncbi:MAG: hypothetical protein HS120_04330 [Burkholderiales bacterium]|nr:hypothetical protein [Burkholderiales bacterium]
MRMAPVSKRHNCKDAESGAELDVLGAIRARVFRVKTGGVEGWVLSRHLMTEPAARVVTKIKQ